MRIAIISDGPELATGFANQARLLAAGLQNLGHTIEYIGWFSQVTEYAGYTPRPYKVYAIKNLNDKKAVADILVREQYDVIIALGDLPYVYFIYKELAADIRNRTFMWLPIDHIPYHLTDHLKEIPNLVLMSEFAEQYVKELPINLQPKNISFIPHGIDITKFYRYDENYLAKLKETNGLTGKWVVGDNFRNSPRKRPDLLIQIWNEFSRNKDDVVLILHTDPRDLMGLPLDYIISNIYKIPASKIKISPQDVRKGIDEAQLNLLYNLWDIRLSTSAGEGFGIVNCETGAVGIPSLLPNHTSAPDLTDSAYLIPCTHRTIDKGGAIRWLVDIDAAVAKLEYYYKNRITIDQRTKLMERIKTKYNINTVITQWNNLVKVVKPNKNKKQTITASVNTKEKENGWELEWI